MPDQLLVRAKQVAAERKTTVRALVVSALERDLQAPVTAFTLRDASVGSIVPGEEAVSDETIGKAIEAQRESRFVP